MIRAQCVHCGEIVGAAIKKENFSESEIAALPQWDDEQKGRHWGRFQEEWKKIEDGAHQQALAQFRKQYEAYRKTDAWKRRCELVMLRAQGICEGCRTSRATEVHHVSYEHCGEEFLFELVAICRPCHDRVHATGAVSYPRANAPRPESRIADQLPIGDVGESPPF